jgi:hypothetical protein
LLSVPHRLRDEIDVFGSITMATSIASIRASGDESEESNHSALSALELKELAVAPASGG